MFEYESRFFAFTIFHYQDFIFMDTAHLHMALQISMTTVVVCMTFSNGKWLEGGPFLQSSREWDEWGQIKLRRCPKIPRLECDP